VCVDSAVSNGSTIMARSARRRAARQAKSSREHEELIENERLLAKTAIMEILEALKIEAYQHRDREHYSRVAVCLLSIFSSWRPVYRALRRWNKLQEIFAYREARCIGIITTSMKQANSTNRTTPIRAATSVLCSKMVSSTIYIDKCVSGAANGNM